MLLATEDLEFRGSCVVELAQPNSCHGGLMVVSLLYPSIRNSMFTCATALVLGACGADQKTAPDATEPAPPPGSNAIPDAPSPPAAATIMVTVRNAPTNASAYNFITAYEDGNGNWQLAPAPAGGVYTFTVNSAAWSFAWACSVAPSGTSPGTSEVSEVGFAVAERTTYTMVVPSECTDHVIPTYTLSGSLANLPATGGTYQASFGNATKPVVVTGATGTFQLTVPDSKHDLVVVHFPATGGVADKVYVQRGLKISADDSVAIDWSGTGVASTTTTSVNASGRSVRTTLYATGTSAKLSQSATLSASLATSQAKTNDQYEQLAFWDSSGETFSSSWMAAVATTGLDQPPAVSSLSAIEAPGGNYPLIAAHWDAYPNAIGYEWSGKQTSGGDVTAYNVTWTALLSPGYLGTTPSFQAPDLSEISGFASTTAFAGLGSNVDVEVFAFGSSIGAQDFPFANPAANGTARERAAGTATVTAL
jgi:hypothetical protein